MAVIIIILCGKPDTGTNRNQRPNIENFLIISFRFFFFFCASFLQLLVADIQIVSDASPIDLHTTKQIRVAENNPILQRAVKVDQLCTEDRDYYLLAGEEAIKLNSISSEDTPCQSSQFDSLTLSEDSDATRIYDLNSRETKILRHNIIKKSRNPIGELLIPAATPATIVDSINKKPTIVVDKTIEQLTNKLLQSANTRETVPKKITSPNKLKPNLFSVAENQHRNERTPAATAVVKRPRHVILHKMASTELVSQQPQLHQLQHQEDVQLVEPVVETQTATNQTSNTETNSATITTADGVTNIESVTNTGNATQIVTETSSSDAARTEAVSTSSAELLEHKEFSTTEGADQTKTTQETSVTASSERNETTVFSESVRDFGADGTALVLSTEGNGVSEAAQVTTSAEEIHRSQSTVVTTEEDPENNCTRTITVTTSLVGVKQRILTESSELITLSEGDAEAYKLAIENGDMSAFPMITSPSNAHIVSEVLKLPIVESPSGTILSEPSVLRHNNYPPVEQGDIIVVSDHNLKSSII